MIVSGEKWGVVAENVTQNLCSHESGSNDALFRDLRAFHGCKEARCRACALALIRRGRGFPYRAASFGRLPDGDAARGIRSLGERIQGHRRPPPKRMAIRKFYSEAHTATADKQGASFERQALRASGTFKRDICGGRSRFEIWSRKVMPPGSGYLTPKACCDAIGL